MHFGCESRHRSHQLHHWHSQSQRRKRGLYFSVSKIWSQFVFFWFLKLMEFWGCLFQVHLIRVSSGGTELICEGLFSHPNEIWDLASCPFDQRIFSTVYSSGIWFHWSWSFIYLFIYIYIYIIQNLIMPPRCLLNNEMHSFGWFVSTF